MIYIINKTVHSRAGMVGMAGQRWRLAAAV